MWNTRRPKQDTKVNATETPSPGWRKVNTKVGHQIAKGVNIATKPPPQVRRSKNSREANQNDSLSGDQHEKVKEQQNDIAERVVSKREETTLGEARRAQTAKARNKSQTVPQGRGRATQMDSERSKKERAGSASRRGQKILLGGTRRAPKRSCGTRLADRVAETEVQRDPKRARGAHHVKSRYELLLEALEEHSKRPCGTHLTSRTVEPGRAILLTS